MTAMAEQKSKMYPYVIFPVVKILENTVRKEENHVSFHAVEEGTRINYIFNAFDTNAEKLNRLKLAGRVVINSEMKMYLDNNNQQKLSFTVLSMRFVDGYSVDFNAKEAKSESKPEGSTSSAQPHSQTQQQSSVQEAPKTQGTIDMDEFAKMFS